MRSVDTTISAAVAAPVVRGIYFIRLCFDSATVGWHSGFGTISLGGIDYVGAGALSSISVVKEETGIKAAAVTVGISGIKTEVVSLLLGQAYLNRKTYVHFVPLDEGDQPVTVHAALLFRGTMDEISGTMGSTASFSVSLKSRLSDWERSRKVLYTVVEQQQLHPGDRGMEFIAQISQKKIIWPRAAFLPDPRD